MRGQFRGLQPGAPGMGCKIWLYLHVYIDGALIYERGAPMDPPSDFELGQSYREGAQ